MSKGIYCRICFIRIANMIDSNKLCNFKKIGIYVVFRYNWQQCQTYLCGKSDSVAKRDRYT